MGQARRRGLPRRVPRQRRRRPEDAQRRLPRPRSAAFYSPLLGRTALACTHGTDRPFSPLSSPFLDSMDTPGRAHRLRLQPALPMLPVAHCLSPGRWALIVLPWSLLPLNVCGSLPPRPLDPALHLSLATHLLPARPRTHMLLVSSDSLASPNPRFPILDP